MKIRINESVPYEDSVKLPLPTQYICTKLNVNQYMNIDILAIDNYIHDTISYINSVELNEDEILDTYPIEAKYGIEAQFYTDYEELL